MPEIDNHRPRRTLPEDDFRPNPRAAFVELGMTSCFSFLRGASDAVDLAATASVHGYDAIGIADLNTMAGVVRLHAEAVKACLRPVIGCRLQLISGEMFLAYPRDRAAYGRLCTLLSKGKMQDREGEWQAKGICDISLDDLAGHSDGVQLILLPGDDLAGFATALPRLKHRLPTLGHIAASYLYRGNDRARINRLDRLAKAHGLCLLATNDVHYHAPDRRPLQDVMTCILNRTTIGKAGFLLHANAERHLKSPAEMVRLFAEWPHAIRAAREVADACAFNLTELAYEYPRETAPEGQSPQTYLERITWAHAAGCYPEGVPKKVQDVLKKELAMIGKLNISQYFLTIHDLIRFARHEVSPPILCQGRGSAANSAVCYVLGITSVDPAQHDLLFERFISEERKEPPDIDVDFEHERREEVIQYIYRKYTRNRAGLCATVIHYRPRSAIREVGKAMGLSEDVTTALAKTIWGSFGREIGAAQAQEAGLDLTDPLLARTIRLADQMIGMPRHLSQHVGGFILTEGPLTATVPIGNGAMADRSFIEWDKDDIDELGILKVDVLALGMLTCIRKAFDLIGQEYDRYLDLAAVPREDPAVYDMLCKGDSIGVFQVESRAQINMLPRLKPRKLYDLVIQVAIVRPGPIQGNMVHPYLRRRSGVEKVTFPSPAPPHDPEELVAVLGKTMGVPLFQEQAMKLAMVAARFSDVEANQLRRAMATFRNVGTMHKFEALMVERMVERGYDRAFAQNCFDQIKGFGSYGFPESHAASFAKLVYISSWIKCHYPAVFACALLNSQPMGFYAPAQIVRDASEHGVEVRPVDINHSLWDNTLERDADGHLALRLGFRQADGMHAAEAERLIAARRDGYLTVEELAARARLPGRPMRALASSDAFRSIGLDRRAALWAVRRLPDDAPLSLFKAADAPELGLEPQARLPLMPLGEHVATDYQTLRLSLKAHPMQVLRPIFAQEGVLTCAGTAASRNGGFVRTAGLVLVRQRPGKGNAIFITLEDETGITNVILWARQFMQFRRAVMGSRLMLVAGRVQKSAEGVIHLMAEHVTDRSSVLDQLWDAPGPRLAAVVTDNPHPPSSAAPRHSHPRNARVLPKSRDFH
jgi:error-prone DNA polymerase